MDTCDVDGDMLGLGVRLAFDYGIKVGINGGNTVIIYDVNSFDWW